MGEHLEQVRRCGAWTVPLPLGGAHSALVAYQINAWEVVADAFAGNLPDHQIRIPWATPS